MSTETSTATGPGPAGTDLPPESARRQKDAIDGPGRPLGPKAALLHARRSRLKVSQPAAAPQSNTVTDSVQLCSEDGAVSFVVTPRSDGLFIERTQRRPLGIHLAQSFVFEDLAAFVRWCEADPIRFDHPVLHGRLRRQGDEHFRAHP